MLDFLKKIFADNGQEAKKIAEIGLLHLDDWLSQRASPFAEEVKRQTEEILMRVDEELQRARFNIEELENAKLQNPNIPFKAKQYMEGNRKAYIRAINSFLGHMEINNRDYYYLLEFTRQFDELLNDLNSGTLRSYTILQEFFANETGKIAQNLRNFDRLFSELKAALNSEKMASINNARSKIQSLKSKSSQRINMGVDLKDAEASLQLALTEKESIMKEIESFTRSDEHNEFLRLNEERKVKETELYNDENQILQSFSVLERPLRKYSHIAFEHEETVIEYIKSPIEALANDKELAITGILKSLEKSIIQSQLQIDDKKKEKSLEEIKKLSKEFLEQFLKRHSSIKGEIENVEARIRSSGVPVKFLDFNKQLDELNRRIEKNTEELDKLKSEYAKIGNSISSLKEEIKYSLRQLTSEEIEITA